MRKDYYSPIQFANYNEADRKIRRHIDDSGPFQPDAALSDAVNECVPPVVPYLSEDFDGDIVIQNDDYLLAYDGSVDLFSLYKKYDDNSVKEAIASGAEYDPYSSSLAELHQELRREAFAKEWSRMVDSKGPMWEFANNDYRYIAYLPDEDKIAFGTCTNAGFCPEDKFDVDYDFSAAANLESAAESMEELYPELGETRSRVR